MTSCAAAAPASHNRFHHRRAYASPPRRKSPAPSAPFQGTRCPFREIRRKGRRDACDDRRVAAQQHARDPVSSLIFFAFCGQTT